MSALQLEGHALLPGTCGENLLLGGIDWKQVVPGTRLEVGSVLLEVTQYSSPCYKQAFNFKGGQYKAISQTRHPGRSRVYCAVLIPGKVRLGDAVRLHLTSRGAKAYSQNASVLGRRPPRLLPGGGELLQGPWLAAAALGLGLLLGRLWAGASRRQ
uniref:MOSC domain-containing protein n=1 Tax=Alexandrium monilatum TaxID=311494 RepID=A0A7S4QD42_9DINO